MNLSKNFTLQEWTITHTGLTNAPTGSEVASLTALCTSLLQPIRDKWGALHVDSGYRAPAVNRAVGGASTSQHVLGEAADIVPLDAEIEKVFEWVVNGSGLKFGQAIYEMKGGVRWIHISLPRPDRPNQQALKYDGIGYHMYA